MKIEQEINNPALPQNPSFAELDSWSKRYLDEGSLWGTAPSECAHKLLSKIKPHSLILEVGCGYGRDTKAFLDNGHYVEAFDKATVGIDRAKQRLNKYINNNHACFVPGDFLTTPIRNIAFDAAFSHRTLHLIDPACAPNIIKRMANVLKPGGILVLSARSPRDFNAQQMKWLNSGNANDNCTTAAYKSRENHIINFYDEERLTRLLRKYFTDFTFSHEEELESCSNLDVFNKYKMSKYIMVTARKKIL